MATQPRPHLVGAGPAPVAPKPASEAAAAPSPTARPGAEGSGEGGQWLRRVLGRSAAPVPDAAAVSGDPLSEFPSEIAPVQPRSKPAVTAPAPVAASSAPAPARSWPQPNRTVLLGIAAAAGLAVVVLAVFALRGPARRAIDWMRTPAKNDGQLSIETRPGGADVIIDGQARGVTPMTLSLTPGPHQVTIRRGTDERAVPLTITAGAQVTQYFDMEPAAVAVAPRGRVSVATDPPGARVSVDGQAHGVSPVTIPELPVGTHRITVAGETGSAERQVVVEAGGTASVVFSLPKVSAPLAGWLSVSAPFDVEVLENNEVVGNSDTSKIMLASGRHDIVLVNRSLQYQETRKVELVPGKVTALRVDPPKAAVSANARPWAEVFVDGNSVGQTPIANLALPIGPHQVSFRHPQFGERRQTVVVTAKGPNRLTVDFTKTN